MCQRVVCYSGISMAGVPPILMRSILVLRCSAVSWGMGIVRAHVALKSILLRVICEYVLRLLQQTAVFQVELCSLYDSCLALAVIHNDDSVVQIITCQDCMVTGYHSVNRACITILTFRHHLAQAQTQHLQPPTSSTLTDMYLHIRIWCMQFACQSHRHA